MIFQILVKLKKWIIYIVFGTKNRDKVLNREFIYPVIVSKYNEKLYLSISPKYYEMVLEYINSIDLVNLNNKEIIDILNNIFKNTLNNFEVKEMYRMCKTNKLDIMNNNAVLLSNKTKQYFMNTGNKSNDIDFKNSKWNEIQYILNSQMIYIVPIDNKIESMAYTSDIQNNGANIIVNTNKTSRKKGYGGNSVAKLTNAILDKNMLPIYFVNINNEPSLKLAKSLEYEKMVTEIVVCVHTRN